MKYFLLLSAIILKWAGTNAQENNLSYNLLKQYSEIFSANKDKTNIYERLSESAGYLFSFENKPTMAAIITVAKQKKNLC